MVVLTLVMTAVVLWCTMDTNQSFLHSGFLAIKQKFCFGVLCDSRRRGIWDNEASCGIMVCMDSENRKEDTYSVYELKDLGALNSSCENPTLRNQAVDSLHGSAASGPSEVLTGFLSIDVSM